MARVGRENHLNTLMGRLPLLTTVYGLQCLLILQFSKEIDVFDFAVYMGASLIVLVVSLFIHDKYHHVLLYKDHLIVYFELFKTYKKIDYKDIEEIIAPSEECDFSSILLKLKGKERIAFHFIDYPVQVKSVMEQLIRESKGNTPEEDLVEDQEAA